MSTPFRLVLPRQLYDDMVAQAKSELPNECCGQLAGRVEAGVARVERRYPLVNELASPTEYLSEPRGLFEADRDRRRRGLEVVAVYHSHPTTHPVPSARDRDRNYSTEVMSIIIGLGGAEPEVRAWWVTADDYREADWEIV